MKILVVDIETTGFLKDNGKIVEVGIVSLDLETGEKEIIYDCVFNPKIDLKILENSWIIKSNYMTVEEILNGLNFEDEKEKIQQIILKSEGVTAYNRSFDIDFLTKYEISFERLLPCPMLISTEICKIPGFYGGYKWPKAEEAYNFFFPESKYIEKHRGADDAMHEADIVYKIHELGKFLPK